MKVSERRGQPFSTTATRAPDEDMKIRRALGPDPCRRRGPVVGFGRLADRLTHIQRDRIERRGAAMGMDELLVDQPQHVADAVEQARHYHLARQALLRQLTE